MLRVACCVGAALLLAGCTPPAPIPSPPAALPSTPAPVAEVSPTRALPTATAPASPTAVPTIAASPTPVVERAVSPAPAPSPSPAVGLAPAFVPTSPSPRASSGASRLLSDDFHDAESGFPNGTAAGGGAEHRYDTAQGEYVIKMLRAAAGGAEASVFDAVVNVYGTFGDFELEVEGRQVGRAANGAWGVIFRVQDFANYYKVSIDPNSGQFEFYKLVGDRRTDFVKWRPTNAIRVGPQPNRLGITARGRELAVRINDIPLATATDDAFREGRLGFIVNVWTEPLEYRFSNLNVWSP